MDGGKIPCMVCVLNTFHSKRISNCHALVYSMNENMNMFFNYVTWESQREAMVSIADVMQQVLSRFQRINNVMPRRILVYQNGVSDSQLSEVKSEEVQRIQSSLDPNVKLISVIVKRRIGP